MGKIKEATNLSPRIRWLRDFYFKGADRGWTNEYRPFTTGTRWDKNYNEMTFYVVPETYAFFKVMSRGSILGAQKIETPPDFYERTIAERRAWFIKKAMVDCVPPEILPGDLLCGAVFNLSASHCLSQEEAGRKDGQINGEKGLTRRTIEFHDRGYGNCGPTSGHIIPGYEIPVKYGFKHIYEDLKVQYEGLSAEEQKGKKGGQLRAMMEAALMPKELAAKYAALCDTLAAKETEPARKAELLRMASNMKKVPWEPAEDFWEAVQSLWFTHMLIMSDENYPGPGLSFGRVDQYLYPYYQKSIEKGEDREILKDILKCMWVHCNTAYDAMIKVGMNQGITAGYGQLLMIGGLGKGGADMTNDLSYLLLEVIDEMSPILEPKPNVRLHKNTPDKFLDKVADMIASSQGAPFLLNFDERSMAGLLREAKFAGVENLINQDNVFDYSAVGCLENTMVGNDRSATVDINLNFLKALELTLGNGKDIAEYKDQLWGKPYKNVQMGPQTGDPRNFKNFDEFYAAFTEQTRFIIKKVVGLYNEGDAIRAEFLPTPYLSCLVKGCAEKGQDVTQGGAEIRFITVEGVTFATTIDSLLAIKYLVYDTKTCTMDELITALRDNWEGHEVLQAKAKNKAPKYGRDDSDADELARSFMEFWSSEVPKYRGANGQIYRGGMLSWNYWISDGYVLCASPDGRKRGQFLSNAICPSNGADSNGPTANSNSVGNALGGRGSSGEYVNYLPNGASHTITMSPSLMRDDDHRTKFKAFLRGYVENGGTALQINVLDPETLREAQKNPEDYRHLLVRVTGYNAYFTSIGRELQNEIIDRESHGKF
ncbi:glycyl radical enzyme [Spirochaetia bacterium]|nr:glycyl radical enzyme [Spirochaetia bacterium]